jgi:hypothetical protein
MVLGKLDIHMHKNIRHICHNTCHKQKAAQKDYLNVRPQTMKLVEEDIGEIL